MSRQADRRQIGSPRKFYIALALLAIAALLSLMAVLLIQTEVSATLMMVAMSFGLFSEVLLYSIRGNRWYIIAAAIFFAAGVVVMALAMLAYHFGALRDLHSLLRFTAASFVPIFLGFVIQALGSR